MIEMRWVEYEAKWPETNGGYETKKKLQYRTLCLWSSEAGVEIDTKNWTEWMNVPTVELENKNV